MIYKKNQYLVMIIQNQKLFIFDSMFILIIYTAYFHCYKRECRNFKKKMVGKMYYKSGNCLHMRQSCFHLKKQVFLEHLKQQFLKLLNFPSSPLGTYKQINLCHIQLSWYLRDKMFIVLQINLKIYKYCA